MGLGPSVAGHGICGKLATTTVFGYPHGVIFSVLASNLIVPASGAAMLTINDVILFLFHDSKKWGIATDERSRMECYNDMVRDTFSLGCCLGKSLVGELELISTSIAMTEGGIFGIRGFIAIFLVGVRLFQFTILVQCVVCDCHLSPRWFGMASMARGRSPDSRPCTTCHMIHRILYRIDRLTHTSIRDRKNNHEPIVSV
jgi:hypothetical protein